jgi:hypothetical protein
VNGAENGAILYGVQVVHPDKTVTEYAFETGLQPGNSREYRLPAQVTYNVKLSNGRGWTKDPQAVYFGKDETFTVTFTGTEEISIDLSGAKGKLTVYNNIPVTNGEYVIENLRVSSEEGGKENLIFYFYTANGIHNGEKPDFDVLPGKYWVRAQIRHPGKDGKLSKWSIPAHVGSYSSTDKEGFEISDNPDTITVSVDKGGFAVFIDKVLSGGNVQNDTTANGPENGLLDANGNETPNVTGSVDPGSDPVKAIKVEKLGFPTADKNGVTNDPKYTYAQKDTAVQVGIIVRTTITVYDQPISGGRTWHLGLGEPGWYLLSFSTNGTTFSRTFPLRLEDKNGNGKIDPNDPDDPNNPNNEVEPPVIPPFNDDDSTWTEKQGVVVNNDTPAAGGQIYKKDSNGNWVKDGDKTLSPAEAQKPVTDIKIFNSDGSLYGHYHDRSGLPIYNGKEWIIFPLLPSGDYLVTLSDDSGATWTDPPYPFHVDGSKNGAIDYDKTHPFWGGGKISGKPGAGLTSPADPKWNDDNNMNWRPDVEIDPNTPVYVVVPSVGSLELDEVNVPPARGSQLDVLHLDNTSSDIPAGIYYIKLNSFSVPDRAYRIIDLTAIGGIQKDKRLSLVGFDFTPGLYYVYLSGNGETWQKYLLPVNIPAAWTPTMVNGNIKINYATGESGGVEKVIYKNPAQAGDWETASNIRTDTDGDGFPDYWEDQYGYDRNNPNVPGKTGDPDGDKLNNWNEYLKGTDPTNPDTDGDGHNDNVDSDPLDPNVPGNNGGNNGGGGDGGGDDGGNTNLPERGLMIIQNLTNAQANPPVVITSLSIRKSDGTYLAYDTTTSYQNYPVSIAPSTFNSFYIPVTSAPQSTATPYTVTLGAGAIVRTYTVSIWHNKNTYVKFRDAAPAGNEITPNPDNSTGEIGTPGGNGGDPGDSNYENNITVIDGSDIPGSVGPMQPGADPVGTYNTNEESGNLFDRNHASKGKRLYPSGQVQPYLPYSPVTVDNPQGGDGTRKNMGNRGYFNFRFHYTADSNWGIGYLAIQKLTTSGSTKTPTGPVITLLNAKAATTTEMQNGAGQARLGNIKTNDADTGTAKGEDRSFNAWRRNWLGLVDPATGWQLNVNGDALDSKQPVYRSGKGHYPTTTTAAYDTDKSDKPANREYGAHRALNNPGRLYTTGVYSDGRATPALGTGFEAGEYRVYLYKGYDSLYKSYTDTAHNDTARQKKMYRYYDDSFDISIYPGVVTTAIYRASLEKTDTKGAFAYTPIPQAAFGKLVVLNSPPSQDYVITAILLDKPGYHTTVESSNIDEVHRYIAAMASDPNFMASMKPSLTSDTNPAPLGGAAWKAMKPLNRGEMHTFILPPGGYRIAVQSTKQRDKVRVWYGEGALTWLPVVVSEGNTAYVTYRGDELSR